jgi:RecB family exonuclease
MEFISSTMFEAFEKCPYAFKLRFIDNLIKKEDDVNKYSKIGQILHDIFHHNSLNKDKNLTVKDLQNMWLKRFEEIDTNLFEDGDDIVKFKQLHLDTIENYHTIEQTLPEPLMTEQEIFFKVSDKLPIVRCTMDRINGSKDDAVNIVVWDYKTGKVYSSDNLRKNLQLPLYAMCCKHLFGEYPKALVLHFPQHNNKERTFLHIGNGKYECKVNRGGTYTFTVEEKLERMEDIYAQIKKGYFKCNTDNSYYCRDYCIANKKGLCEGIKTEWSKK